MRSMLWCLIALTLGCSSPHQNIQPPANELLEFAKASCFFWYFKKKDYDLSDIRSISGGIVEMGTYSAEKYREVSLKVKEYAPALQTQQDIDPDLLKCFRLDKDAEFIQSIRHISGA